jgi:CheY-like chemotaxis protein
MVVDDNDQSLQSLSLVLGDLGHDLHAFSDPLKALLVAKREFYPLIITDIRMPGLDGLKLLTRLKEDPVRKRKRCGADNRVRRHADGRRRAAARGLRLSQQAH